MDKQGFSAIQSLSGPVLITGHTGFKGTWLTQLLETLGVEVIGYSLPPEKDSLFDRMKREGSVREVFADIRDFTGFQKFVTQSKPSAIVHMAAQPLVLESYVHPRETFEINVQGTANVLDTSNLSDSVKAVVVVTTDKVYKNLNNSRSFIEEDALEGKDPYSASKVATESVAAAWRQITKINGGAPNIAVRAGNVIGGGDWSKDRLMPDLIRGFFRSETVQVRNPESTRPWQHALDPLHGYLLALNSILRGNKEESFNFGPQGRSLSVAKVVQIASNTWPTETSIEYLESDSDQEALTLELDSTSAQKKLGWSPSWSQEEAIKATVNWWKSVILDHAPPVEECQKDIDWLITKIMDEN